MAQKFFSDVSLESSSNLTLVDGILTVNDGNNYVKISEGTNSIGEIELKDSSSVFVQGWGNDFRVAVGTYNNHALTINSSKNATFAGTITSGNITTYSRITFDYNGSGSGNNYLETGTNSAHFKNSSGTSTLGLNFSDQSATVGGNLTVTGGTVTLGSDVSLFRDGANILRTDDTFHANNDIHVGGAGKIYDRGDTNTYVDFGGGSFHVNAHNVITSGHYLEVNAMGKLINMDVSGWTSGQQEHNILYSGWTSGTGDYLSIKVAGNSSSAHGNLIIGDNGLWFGRANTTDSAQATDSNTNPHPGSGSNYFRVNTAGQLQVSGSVVSPIYYDTSGTTYYLDLGNTSNSLTIPGIISMADNKGVTWSGGSIRAEGNTLKLVASTLIDLQDNTQVQGNLSLVGDDRILNLAGGSTTNSQSRVIIGEQGTYGVSFRWNSSADLEFDGFWNSSVTGSRNRDLGSVDVNNRRWNFENTVVVGGSVTAGSFVKSGGTSSQYLMADGSVSTSAGGTIDGSGAANRLAIWSDSDTLTSNVNITVSSGQLNLGNGLLVEDNDTTVITAKAYEPHIVWQKTRGSSGDDYFKIKLKTMQ